MKKNLKLLGLLFLVLSMPFVLISSGSGGSGGGSKKAPQQQQQCVQLTTTNLILFQMYGMPSNRISSWSVPVIPSLWTGAPSATGFFDNPNTRFYCKVTITSTRCKDYGNNGVKEYTWLKNQNIANMTIQVPSNDNFRIRVDYYEQCGPYWGSFSSPQYRRGHWRAESGILGASSGISLSNWSFITTNPC
ncbi:MAG: hypothetical protein ACK4JX_03150 [Flavobacterium sp.]